MDAQIDDTELGDVEMADFRRRVAEFLEANCSRAGDRSGTVGDEDPEGVATARKPRFTNGPKLRMPPRR